MSRCSVHIAIRLDQGIFAENLFFTLISIAPYFQTDIIFDLLGW